MPFFPDPFAAMLGRPWRNAATTFDVVQRPIAGRSGERLRPGPGGRERGRNCIEALPPYLPAYRWAGADPGGHEALSDGELAVVDRWIDLEQDWDDEDAHQEVCRRLANRIPFALRYFDGLMRAIRQRPSVHRAAAALVDAHVLADARKPLIVQMEALVHTPLRALAPRLTRHLRREHQLVPLGRVQEVDAYCLRHLMRRPGRDIGEKAGPRQTIMGIQRQESHDSGENRFVKAFCSLLAEEAGRARRRGLGEHEDVVERFKGFLDGIVHHGPLSEVANVPAAHVRLNNVLMNRQDYFELFQAYKAYQVYRQQTEHAWSHRQAILTDWVFYQLAVALASLDGARPTDDACPRTPWRVPTPAEAAAAEGYLPLAASFAARWSLGDHAFSFDLERTPRHPLWDLALRVGRQQLEAPLDEAPTLARFPIWVWWGAPGEETLERAASYLALRGRDGLLVVMDEGLETAAPVSRGRLTLLRLGAPPEAATAGAAWLSGVRQEIAEALLDMLALRSPVGAI